MNITPISFNTFKGTAPAKSGTSDKRVSIQAQINELEKARADFSTDINMQQREIYKQANEQIAKLNEIALLRDLHIQKKIDFLREKLNDN